MREDCENKKVYCTMDYHNQKYADITYTGKNPRNEIRLYMNNAIDPNRRFFFKEDLAVFERFDVNGQPVYSLTRISPAHEEYEGLRDLVYSGDTRYHSDLAIEDDFDFITKPDIEGISEIVLTEDARTVIERETESVFGTDIEIETDTETTNEDTSFEDEMGYSFFNSNLFHDLVMNAYHYKCAITGKAIRYKDLYNLETAHIKAKAHNGTYLPCNGIAMSRDMHFAFDKGFFTITDDYKVEVSEKLKGDWFYEEFNGKPIYVPTEDYFKPRKEYLAHHRKEVFNTFKQIRQLQ